MTASTNVEKASQGQAATVPARPAVWLGLFLMPGLLAAATGCYLYLGSDSRSTLRLLLMLGGVGSLLVTTMLLVIAPIRRRLIAARWGIVLAVASTVIALAVAEAVLQWALHPPGLHFEGNIFRGDERFGDDHVPGASARHWRPGLFDAQYNINESGTRGTSFDAIAGREHKMILVVGCSQTFGWGVGDEESWPARLEQSLADASHYDEMLGAAVINRAVIADGPSQMVLRAEAFAQEIARPDLILIALQEIHLDRLGADYRWNQILAAKGVRVPQFTFDSEGNAIISGYAPEYVEEVAPDDVNMLNDGEFDREIQLKRFGLSAVFTILRSRRPAEEQATPETWELFEASLARLGELAHRESIPIAIVMLPKKPDHDPRWRDTFREHLQSWSSQFGLMLWDIEDDVAAAAGGESIVYHPINEYHFNATGAEAIGRVVANRVATMKRGSSN